MAQTEPADRRPTPTMQADAPASPTGKIEQLKVIGGLAALVAGLMALIAVLGLAIASKVTEQQFTQLATTVIGVVGSIVGAYFGVKVGSEGTEKALESQRQEAARAQIFAAHLPPNEAAEALRLAFPDPAVPPAPDPAVPPAPGPGLT